MALTVNRNRFLSGLSDISKIVDDGGIPDAPIALVPPPVIVSLSNSNSGSNSGSTSEVWVEQETTATLAGVQTIQLDYNVGGFYTLCINGLKQSKSAYSITGLSLLLPSTLQIESGDVIDFTYIKQ